MEPVPDLVPARDAAPVLEQLHQQDAGEEPADVREERDAGRHLRMHREELGSPETIWSAIHQTSIR